MDEVDVEIDVLGGGEVADVTVLGAPRDTSQCSDGTLVVLEDMEEQLVLVPSWDERGLSTCSGIPCKVPGSGLSRVGESSSAGIDLSGAGTRSIGTVSPGWCARNVSMQGVKELPNAVFRSTCGPTNNARPRPLPGLQEPLGAGLRSRSCTRMGRPS